MSETCSTIQVKIGGEVVTINEEDFDAKIHKHLSSKEEAKIDQETELRAELAEEKESKEEAKASKKK